MAQYQLRALYSNLKIFMVFIYIWQKDVAKISEMPGAQREVNPAGNNMVSKRTVTIYCTIFQ